MKPQLLKKTLFLIFIVLQFQVQAQYETKTTFLSHEDMRVDFKEFVKLLEETHVDPYTAMGGKINFKVRVVDFEDKIIHTDAIRRGFAELIAEFIAPLKDNHTWIKLSDAPSVNENKILPLFFTEVSDGIYVKFAKKAYKEFFRAKVVSINGNSIDELLEKTKKLRASENRSNALVNLCKLLEKQNTIRKLFPEVKESLSFSVVTTNLDTLQREIPLLIPTTYKKMPWLKAANGKGSKQDGIFGYKFTDKKKKVAYFRLDEMFAQEVVQMIRAEKANYSAWIAMNVNLYPKLKSKYGAEKVADHLPYFSEAFRNLLLEMQENKSEYLVLDLTKNPGGYTDMAIPALYMLFGDKAFSNKATWGSVTRISQLFLDKFQTTLDEYNADHEMELSLGDYQFFDKQEGEAADTTLVKRRKAYFKKLEKNNYGWGKFIADLDGKPIYTPKIIVLTSAKTNSAAYHFLYKLHRLSDISVVGVAPQQAGNTPMEGTSFTLPLSKLEGSISNGYQMLFPQGHPKVHLFTPDFQMNWKDYKKMNFVPFAELEYALELIEKGKIRRIDQK